MKLWLTRTVSIAAHPENSLTAAAVSAEVMVNDRTCQDNVVDVAEMLIDPNRSSAGSRTEVLKVFLLVAETVVHLQTRSNVLANCLNHFFLCHRTMCTQGEDDVHIFIFDAELIHLIDEDRHEIKAVCDAGRIVADESNFLARFNDFVDGRTSNRVVDRLENFVGDVFRGSNSLVRTSFRTRVSSSSISLEPCP